MKLQECRAQAARATEAVEESAASSAAAKDAHARQVREQSVKEADSVLETTLKSAKDRFSSCYTDASNEFREGIEAAAAKAASSSKELLKSTSGSSTLGESNSPQVVLDCSGQASDDCEELPVVTDCKCGVTRIAKRRANREQREQDQKQADEWLKEVDAKFAEQLKAVSLERSDADEENKLALNEAAEAQSDEHNNK